MKSTLQQAFSFEMKSRLVTQDDLTKMACGTFFTGENRQSVFWFKNNGSIDSLFVTQVNQFIIITMIIGIALVVEELNKGPRLVLRYPPTIAQLEAVDTTHFSKYFNDYISIR